MVSRFQPTAPKLTRRIFISVLTICLLVQTPHHTIPVYSKNSDSDGGSLYMPLRLLRCSAVHFGQLSYHHPAWNFAAQLASSLASLSRSYVENGRLWYSEAKHFSGHAYCPVTRRRDKKNNYSIHECTIGTRRNCMCVGFSRARVVLSFDRIPRTVA